MGLRLDRDQHHCDGIAERSWSTFWFIVDENGQVAAVDAPLRSHQGPYSMHLLDVADLDGNGDPEAIFFWSGYNDDGYLLVHDRFRRQEAFTWQYHWPRNVWGKRVSEDTGACFASARSHRSASERWGNGDATPEPDRVGHLGVCFGLAVS